jgi:hypothetical protein
MGDMQDWFLVFIPIGVGICLVANPDLIKDAIYWLGIVVR